MKLEDNYFLYVIMYFLWVMNQRKLTDFDVWYYFISPISPINIFPRQLLPLI